MAVACLLTHSRRSIFEHAVTASAAVALASRLDADTQKNVSTRAFYELPAYPDTFERPERSRKGP